MCEVQKIEFSLDRVDRQSNINMFFMIGGNAVKKILQFGLCAFVACGFVDVNAAQWNKIRIYEYQKAKVQGLLPAIVAEHERLMSYVCDTFQFYVEHPTEKPAKRKVECPALYDFVEMIKRDISGYICPILGSELQEVLQQMRASGENQLYAWEGLHERSYSEWEDLFKSLYDMTDAVNRLKDKTLNCLGSVNQYLLILEIASILESNGKTVQTTFSAIGYRCRSALGFDLCPNGALEWENGGKDDYIRRIAALKCADEAGLTTDVSIFIDERLSEVLSNYLKLRRNTELDKDLNVRKYITFYGSKANPLDMAKIPFAVIESGRPVDKLSFINAQWRFDKSLCDLFINHKVKSLYIRNVAVDRAEEGDVGDLSKTLITSFEYDGINSIDAAVWWLKRLPEAIRNVTLFRHTGFVVSEETQAIFKCALALCPNIKRLEVGGAQITLETIVSAVLHPSLEQASFATGDIIFLEEGFFISGVLQVFLEDFYGYEELVATHGQLTDLERKLRKYFIERNAGDLASALLAIRKKCSPSLKNPYKHADFLLGILTSLIELRSLLAFSDKSLFSNVNEEFCKIVEGECSKGGIKTDEDFKGILKKAYFSSMGKVVQFKEAYLSSMEKVVQVSDDRLQKTIAYATKF